MNARSTQIPEPNISRLLFADTRLAPLWAIFRVYLGWQWLEASWGKFNNPAWVGEKAGTAVSGFLSRALTKAEGERPYATGWYAWFIENAALPNATLFSYLVTYGEILVGLALIAGLFTGIAAFLMAGTVSSNPWMFIVATWLVLAWRTAGYWGLDRWVLLKVGVPGVAGELFRRKERDDG